MAEQQLYGSNVAALLQQVHGEGVSQRMRSNRFGNVAESVRPLASLLNRVLADVLPGFIAREQPVLGPFHAPPLTQGREQLRREHHIAIFLSLALLDT